MDKDITTDTLDAKKDTVRYRRWRMRMARHAESLTRPFQWLLRAAELASEGLPVGLLQNHEIEQLVSEAYREVPDFYNPNHYPIRFEQELIPVLQRLQNGRRLLDLYCGHGREAELFSRAGYRVLGVDRLDSVIERARDYASESGFTAEFLCADVTGWQPPHKDWDVVYTSLWMYSTIPDRKARIAWLQRLASWPVADGLLVVSTMPRIQNRGPYFRHIIACLAAALSFNKRWPELGDRFYKRLFWHDFRDDEAIAEFCAAGLDHLESIALNNKTPCTFHILKPRQQNPK